MLALWKASGHLSSVGVAPARISACDNGTQTDCNLSTAQRLARALGCRIDSLADTWDADEAAAPALAAARG